MLSQAGEELDWTAHKMQVKQFDYEMKAQRIFFIENCAQLLSIGAEKYPDFKIEIFTKKPSALVLEIKKRLFSYITPESTHPFEKIQSNFLYQFLKRETREKLQSLQVSDRLEPSC